MGYKGWGYGPPLRHPVAAGGGHKLVGVLQPKPMHGFSPNFRDMLTPGGSSADEFLWGIWQQLFPCQHF